jgi:hypothetical protein
MTLKIPDNTRHARIVHQLVGPSDGSNCDASYSLTESECLLRRLLNDTRLEINRSKPDGQRRQEQRLFQHDDRTIGCLLEVNPVPEPSMSSCEMYYVEVSIDRRPIYSRYA